MAAPRQPPGYMPQPPGPATPAYLWPAAAPVPPPLPKKSRVALIVVLIIIVVVVAAVGVFVAVAGLAGITGTPTGTYTAILTSPSHYTTMNYSGQAPLQNHWFIANVTLNNTGTASLSPSASSFDVADFNGDFMEAAESQFFTTVTVGPGHTASLALVFDMSIYDYPPAKVILTLPNGNQVAANV